MELSVYIVEIYNHLSFYIPTFLGFLLAYYLLYKKATFNIVDPFVIEAIIGAGAAFAVFVMFYTGNIQTKYWVSFLTSEIALFVGLYFMSVTSPKEMSNRVYYTDSEFTDIVVNKRLTIVLIYRLTFLLFLLINMVSIALVGVVLLSTEEGVNHVSAYDGMGILLVLKLCITPLFLTVFFVKYKMLGKLSLADYIAMGITLLFLLLSGSKSSFIVIILGFAVVDYYFSAVQNKPRTRIPVKYLLFLVVSILLILSIGNFGGGGTQSAYFKLFDRLILSGDVFLLGYNDRVMRFFEENINAIGYINYPLYSKFLRLMAMENVPPNIGVTVYNFEYGITTSGGNSRHNYVAYIFGGEYFSWLYSLILGLFIGFIRFRLFYRIRLEHTYKMCFFLLLMIEIPSCVTDTYLFNTKLFIYIILFLVIYLLVESFKRSVRNQLK